MTVLRPYQNDVIHEVRREVVKGRKRIIVVAATGAGKTIIASEIIRSGVERGSRVLFVAHRRELIKQSSRKLVDADVLHGIILAGEPQDEERPVQVASVQTLWSRAIRREVMPLPPADIVVVDECHRARARTYQKILDAYPSAIILGLTATPCRGDGRGLGNVFDTMVECPPVSDLIDLEYLVPTRVFAPTTPDLKGVEIRRGDYVERQLAERMDDAALIGDIVSHWHRLADNRKSVVFASGVQHSIHLRDEFRRTSVWAEHIDGKTPRVERDAILSRLSSGEIDLVTNCMVLTEGWDQPDVSCVVLARPTKHMGLYRQMVGRVLRPFEDKTDALVIDHAGAVFEHGFVEEPVLWTLDVDSRAENPAHESRKGTTGMIKCPECGAVYMERPACPSCGHRHIPKGRAVDVRDGLLGEVDRTGHVTGEHPTFQDRLRWWRQLKWIQEKHEYKPGWIAHKFKARFGVWPRGMYGEPEMPEPEVSAFIRHLNIRYAKRQKKEAA